VLNAILVSAGIRYRGPLLAMRRRSLPAASPSRANSEHQPVGVDDDPPSAGDEQPMVDPRRNEVHQISAPTRALPRGMVI